MYEYIDLLKEVCLLGNDVEPLPSSVYLAEAIKLIPARTDDDKTNFEQMKDLMVETLSVIESIDNPTKGEDNLIGDIAQDIQNNLGLVNLQVK